jgi:uncharacterized protein
MFGLPLEQVATLILMFFVAGVLTGFLAGLFGISGGGVIVPVLFGTFSILQVPEAVRMQLSVGTSLAIIIPTAIRSYRAHSAFGPANKDVLRLWVLPALGGVVTGSAVAAFTSGDVLKIAFVVVSTLIALKLIVGRNNWYVGDRLPSKAVMTGYGYIIGLIASLIGVGGGAISTAILTLYRKPIHEAIGISAGLGVAITTVGMIGYAVAGWHDRAVLPPFSFGYVSPIGFVLMAPISMFVAPYGARVAHRLSKRQLETAFGIFLLASCARFVVEMAR